MTGRRNIEEDRRLLSIELKNPIEIGGVKFRSFSWHPEDDKVASSKKTLSEIRSEILRDGMLFRGRRKVDDWKIFIKAEQIESVEITTHAKHMSKRFLNKSFVAHKY